LAAMIKSGLEVWPWKWTWHVRTETSPTLSALLQSDNIGATTEIFDTRTTAGKSRIQHGTVT